MVVHRTLFPGVLQEDQFNEMEGFARSVCESSYFHGAAKRASKVQRVIYAIKVRFLLSFPFSVQNETHLTRASQHSHLNQVVLCLPKYRHGCERGNNVEEFRLCVETTAQQPATTKKALARTKQPSKMKPLIIQGIG